MVPPGCWRLGITTYRPCGNFGFGVALGVAVGAIVAVATATGGALGAALGEPHAAMTITSPMAHAKARTVRAYRRIIEAHAARSPSGLGRLPFKEEVSGSNH